MNDEQARALRESTAASLLVVEELIAVRQLLKGEGLAPEQHRTEALTRWRQLVIQLEQDAAQSTREALPEGNTQPVYDSSTSQVLQVWDGDDVRGPRFGTSLFGMRYRIDGVLGRGGMGTVYAAFDLQELRDVALKLARVTGNPGTLEAFFRHEATALSRLDHPNTVRVFDTGESHGRLYVVMERLHGTTLRARLASQSPMGSDDAWAITRGIAAGLAAAHDAALVHRDIKPENIWLKEHTGEPKVLDFGLAIVDAFDALGAVTAVGNVAGTSAYMSPEQFNGQLLTPATDVYSVGVILLEMLLGENTFAGNTFASTMFNHVSRAPVLPSARHIAVDPRREHLLARMLAKDPLQRPQDGEALLAAIDAIH